jgi:hypothetical protein
MKTIAKLLWRRKVTVLAVVVAFTVGTASTALAANGGNFILGVLTNSATAITKLTGNVAGPSLQIVNPNTGVAARALDLQVAPGQPPLTVNPMAGKATNLNADKVDGKDSTAFVNNSTYISESPLGPGLALGDGTHRIDVSCLSGDRLLSGGLANINPTSTVLESFPANTGTWAARIQKNGFADNFSAIALCADQ